MNKIFKILLLIQITNFSLSYSCDAQSAGCSNQAQDNTDYLVVLSLNPDNLMLKPIIEAFGPFGGRKQPYMRFKSIPGSSTPLEEAIKRLSEIKVRGVSDHLSVFSDELNKDTPIQSFGGSGTRKGLRASVIINNSQPVLERIFGALNFNTELIFLDPESIRASERKNIARKALDFLSTEAKLVNVVRQNWKQGRPLLISAITIVGPQKYTKKIPKIVKLEGYDSPYSTTPYRERDPRERTPKWPPTPYHLTLNNDIGREEYREELKRYIEAGCRH